MTDMLDDLHELGRDLVAAGEGTDASVVLWAVEEIEKLRAAIRAVADGSWIIRPEHWTKTPNT